MTIRWRPGARDRLGSMLYRPARGVPPAASFPYDEATEDHAMLSSLRRMAAGREAQGCQNCHGSTRVAVTAGRDRPMHGDADTMYWPGIGWSTRAGGSRTVRDRGACRAC